MSESVVRETITLELSRNEVEEILLVLAAAEDAEEALKKISKELEDAKNALEAVNKTALGLKRKIFEIRREQTFTDELITW